MPGSLTNKLKNHNPVTEFDRILLYWVSDPGEIELSEREARRMKRIEYAYEQLDKYTDKEVKNMLIKEFDINRSTAYQDIADAYEIHGRTGKLRKNVELYFLLQDSKRAVRDAFASGNIIAKTKAIEARAKVLAMLPDEEEESNKYGPSNFYLIINQGAGENALKIDLTKAHELPFAEFQVLSSRLLQNNLDETNKILEAEENDDES